jgi:Undecaprenyl-phosphate glucose phosphotransferase
MLKSNEKLFSFTQKLLDALTAGVCWLLAYHLRFNYSDLAQSGLGPLFFQLTPLLMVLTIYTFYKFGLYKSQRFNSRFKEITAVFYANSIVAVAFVVFLYFFASNRLSRLTIVYYYFFSSFGLTLMRIMVRNYLRALRRKGKNLRHVLLVGNGDQLLKYVDTVKDFKDSGIRFLGWIDGGNLAIEKNIAPLNITLEEAKAALSPDAIVIGYKSIDSFQVDKILRKHFNDVIPIQVLPDLTYSFIGHRIDDFDGIPLLTLNQPKLDGIGSFFKRSFDILSCSLGLLFISPLFILIGLLIKLTSRGPVFYGQERMGLDGMPFTMWKFRTMKVSHADEDKTTWTTKDDPRKTPIGALLRKTSIDEFPQLLNVLMGDMSLVGPRPERPFFVEKFNQEIPGYMLRHKMKSGITGWAQINGWRGDTSIAKRIECDNFYIKNWSFWLDLKILFLTFWKGFVNKNAY